MKILIELGVFIVFIIYYDLCIKFIYTIYILFVESITYDSLGAFSLLALFLSFYVICKS